MTTPDAVALSLLDAWEAEDLKAPRPCPELLGWVADCRAAITGNGADKAARLGEVAAFADHLADLDAEEAA